MGAPFFFMKFIYLCTHLTEVRILMANSGGVPVDLLLINSSIRLIRLKSNGDIVFRLGGLMVAE